MSRYITVFHILFPILTTHANRQKRLLFLAHAEIADLLSQVRLHHQTCLQ